MAWVETRNGVIRGGYRDASKRRRYVQEDPRTGKPFRNEKEARRVAEATEQEERARRRPRGQEMTCGRWFDHWYPTRAVEASTGRGSDPKMRHQVRPQWGSVPLLDVDRLDVQQWVTTMSRSGLSASTVRQAYYLLRSALDAAVVDRDVALDWNPCQGVKLPALPIGQERYLTEPEQQAIFYHLDGVHRVLVELLVGTGLRISEAAGLHWSRVDLDRGVIVVLETWDAKAGTIKGYPKSRKGRTVPMTEDLTELLWHWQDENPSTGTCGRPHLLGSACRSSLVFLGPRGGPISPTTFSERIWSPAVDLSGVGHVRVHDLRHTYASRLLTAGVPIERVSKLLGHASVKTTERYAHFIDDGHDEVRAALAQGTERGTRGLRAVRSGPTPESTRSTG